MYYINLSTLQTSQQQALLCLAALNGCQHMTTKNLSQKEMVQHEPVNNNAVSSINDDLSIHTTGLFLLQFTTQSSLCTVASAYLKKGRKQANEWGGKRKHLQPKLLSTTVTVFALHIIQ